MAPDYTHPGLSDLARRARRRIPHFVWEYLDCGTGTDDARRRNRHALDRIRLVPRGLAGEVAPRLSCSLLGQTWSMPVGIAPIGMSGLVWPGAEEILARTARDAGIPYCLSTVATRTPEEIGSVAGPSGWFQLYPPRDAEIRRDILRRAAGAGFRVLVLTIDVPVMSRRERQRRAGIRVPPRLSPRILWQIAQRPAWALGTLRHGIPGLPLMASYAPAGGTSVARADHALRTAPDTAYLARLREEWAGPLVVKGVMDPDLAATLPDAGVDAVWVSNHGGRQLDAAPAAIEALPAVRRAVGPGFPVIFDSGVESAVDVLRALALGADFVMLGRAWHHAVAALGAEGARYLARMLAEDLAVNMVQMGAATLSDLPARRWRSGSDD
ncbi:MAG: alpha-hydroxy-acid oxidizing protein [Alphaproteobacteria bacterium]|nr:MAG: alpha-hydroxy-acid oxidizing protein [Alphaproteobacteria bacterium]